MSLAAHTLNFLRAHQLLEKPGVVAVSGGADSVALAHVLGALWLIGEVPNLTLAHLNHGLRGEESEGDERWVRGLATDWGWPTLNVVVDRADVAELARTNGWNLEDAGRRARYRFLSDTARGVGASWVATAHTADDQAETVLMRLLRGSGLQGLSGIPAVRPLDEKILLIRPWLGVRRAEARAYLAAGNLSYREDSSNADPRFTRNRLRKEVMPLLEANYQPALVAVLERLAEQAGEVQSFLEAQAGELRYRAEKPPAPPVLVFDAPLLAAAPLPVVREMFRQVWGRQGWAQGDMGYEQWTLLARLPRGERAAVDFPGPVRARIRGKVLQLFSLGQKK